MSGPTVIEITSSLLRGLLGDRFDAAMISVDALMHELAACEGRDYLVDVQSRTADSGRVFIDTSIVEPVKPDVEIDTAGLPELEAADGADADDDDPPPFHHRPFALERPIRGWR
jgi:hypothetical protein